MTSATRKESPIVWVCYAVVGLVFLAVDLLGIQL